MTVFLLSQVKWIEASPSDKNSDNKKYYDDTKITDTPENRDELNNVNNLKPKNSRLKYAQELIKSIRFMCMTAEELADYVEPVEFMKSIPECNAFLMNAYRYHA